MPRQRRRAVRTDRDPSATWFIVIMAMVILLGLWLYLQPEVWTEWR